MVRCPRCGGATERLHSLPRAALADGPHSGATVDGDPVACRWCFREITEG